jgi:4'-phosphopantetheinyl transferase
VKLLPGDVHVWTVPLDVASWGDHLTEGGLDVHEVARASRFHFAADRRRFVVSHAATRAILARYLGVAPGALFMRGADGGKPALDPARHGAGLRFNVSHSGEVAVVAVGDREVGVDVEHVRPLPDLDALVARWFSRPERRAFEALLPAARVAAFFACWTLKEAYLKGCGDGLARALDGFTTTVPPDEVPRLTHVGDRAGDEARWALRRLVLPPGYVGAVAVENPEAASVGGSEPFHLAQFVWGER